MSDTKPQHIAIVMDGNGRWAKQRKLKTASGHRAGVETVRTVLDACQQQGVLCLTLFAFSSENWRRPKLEVDALMRLFSSYLDSEVNNLHAKGTRLKFIGRRDRFSKTLLKKIQKAEVTTQDNTQFYLNLAVDYGGQWDLAQACQQIAFKTQQGLLQPEAIDEALLGQHLSLADLPAVDFLIRTSGEQRLSNFLLWQSAYAELYFSDVLWPDFNEQDLADALDFYATRERRFGGRNEC